MAAGESGTARLLPWNNSSRGGTSRRRMSVAPGQQEAGQARAARALGDAYEAPLRRQPRQRKAGGAYYTPEPIVQQAVARALRPTLAAHLAPLARERSLPRVGNGGAARDGERLARALDFR